MKLDKMTILSGKIDQLIEKMQKLKEENDGLRGVLEGKGDDKSGLNGRMDQLIEEIDILKEQIKEKQEEVMKLQTMNDEMLNMFRETSEVVDEVLSKIDLI